ncbi:hypothetical protein N7478_009202 [Penicillium angulare]|uniref:uncharacterized protein n=1 Tax=Penicillium angulare TaxID=116970 RepID=UPI0025419BD4|nr:uncharacterized protein N7478_009202 [Penicillium angulare]KAJ5274077.1 hypothetical protein N7478_009202 [Penicillium angulare]
MTEIKPAVSVASSEWNEVEKPGNEITSPKMPCSTHGPSQCPRVDTEVQKQQTTALINALIQGLSDLKDTGGCTRCTVENVSALLTGHIRDIRTAKQNGEWTKTERKALKAETKALFKPMKKDLKRLWKERS